jgi:phage minor structural protein
MATSRGLITTREDFIPDDYAEPTVLGYPGREFYPYVYYNGENLPTGLKPDYGSNYDVTYGTAAPEYVNGVRGKAHRFNGRNDDYMIFRNWYLPRNMDTDRWMISFFYTPSNLSPQWQGLVTTRGDGAASDAGFHISMYGAYLNVRGYGMDIADLYSNREADSPDGKTMTFQVGQRYHILVVSEPSETYKFVVYVNGERLLGTTKWIRPGWNTRSITIGNFLSSASAIYPAFGDIDEVLFFSGNDSTPTIAEMDTYRNYFTTIYPEGRYIDYDTNPGSIQLAKKPDGTYAAGVPVSWTSKTIDIGEPPIEYMGRVQVNYEYNPNSHTIQIFTRVSDDGVNFDDWRELGSDGTIFSPNKRYYQIRVTLITSDNTSTPIVKELEILEYAQAKQYALISEPLRVYADQDTGLLPMGILNNAYDVIIEEEVKSKDILTFKLPLNDPKRRSLGTDAVEFLIRLGNRRYILKENSDKKDSSGKKISSFKAEAKWYELNDPKVPEYELVEADVTAHVNKILSECVPSVSWKLNLNLSTKKQKRTIKATWKSVLALLRDVEKTFGVEIKFYYDEESDSDLFDIVDQIGEDKKIRFYWNKNIKEIERVIDTYGMVTRLYLYGAGGLDITTVNNGVPYVENLKWVNKLKLRNKIRPDQFSDERYTIPENLMDDGLAMLEESSKPNLTYAMSLQDLSSRSGHEPESINLGDTVYPIDEDLMIDYLPSRIMRRKYYVREPYKTEIETEQPKKELADAQSRAFDDSVQNLTETDPVSSSDIQEMTVFNHLLNSRADDGLDEWTYNGTGGITATSEGGFSGDNSFKIVAKYDEYKQIAQEVFNVSHRTNYTISAMVYKEGNITAGANGFVGIRVKVRYKPDENGVVKEETKLLKIPDVTNMTYDKDE